MTAVSVLPPGRVVVRAYRAQAVASVYHLGGKWHTGLMPTARPRHQVTETPDVARALDLAAKRWPGVARSKLLLRLVDIAGNSLERDECARAADHRAAVTGSSGQFDDAFGPGYLTGLRADWPA